MRWVLHHEVYTGTDVRGKRSTNDTEGSRIPNAFPPIVSTADFTKAQENMASQSPKNPHPRRVANRCVLSRLARCETHERSMTTRGSNKTHGYYTCGVIIDRGVGGCDTPR